MEPFLIGFVLGHGVNEFQKWIDPQIVETTGVGWVRGQRKAETPIFRNAIDKIIRHHRNDFPCPRVDSTVRVGKPAVS